MFQLTQLPQELDHGETTVCHHHQQAFRQPTASLQNHLQSPLGKFLVLARFALIVSLGRCQHSEKGQSPRPSSPWNGGQQHQAQPTQSTGLHKMTMARADWIPIDTLRFYLGSPTPFDGVIQSHDDWPPPGKGADQEPQQKTTRFQTRPSCTIQNPMVILKMLLHTQPHHAQRRGHGSFGGRQDRTRQQNLRMFPNSLREEPLKGSQDRDIFGLQGWHRLPRGGVLVLAYPAFLQDSNG